jgi:hypothetical protein
MHERGKKGRQGKAALTTPAKIFSIQKNPTQNKYPYNSAKPFKEKDRLQLQDISSFRYE